MGKLLSPDSLTPHPTLPLIIPPMSDEEYADLKESLKTFGQHQDVVIDLAGYIIDGHHRWKALKELGAQYVSVFPANSALAGAKAIRLGIELNAHRRQWSRDNRRTAVEKLLTLEPQLSDREIARTVGVSPTTVGSARAALEDSGVVSKLDTRVGRDGVQQQYSKTHRAKAQVQEPLSKADQTVGEGMETSANNGKQLKGPGVQVPDGLTIEQAIREGLALEDAGYSSEEAADKVGIRASNYREGRYVVLIHDRKDLSEKNRALAVSCLAEMNENLRVRAPYERLSHLIDAIYGPASSRTTPAQSEATRKAAFERGYGAIVEACMLQSQVEVPYLAPQRASELVAELDEASRQLRALRDRLKEYAE